MKPVSTAAQSRRMRRASRRHFDLRAGILACFLAAATLLSPVSTRAENNSNYIFNGTTTNFGGVFNLPTTGTGTNNSLQILNAGSVTNTDANIGNGGSDHFNYALVRDSGSLWYNSGNLSIGSSGMGNYLIVTNGGRVDDFWSRIGYNPGSSNNWALVTGNGSLWQQGFLSVGYFGSSNALTIANGGRVNVTAGGTSASLGGVTGGDNNLLLVTGPGSVYSNANTTVVGYQGANNQMVLSNGAYAYSASLQIGQYPGSTGNSVVVTGAGTTNSSIRSE